MITSANIVGTPTDTNYNGLRADLVTNHKHTGVDGAKIDHGQLLHPNGYEIIHEHEEVDEHIDSPSGVHGQPSGVYAAGVVGGKLGIVSGKWSNTEAETGEAYRTIYDDHWVTLKVSLSPLSNANPAFDGSGVPQGSIEMADTDYVVTVSVVSDSGKLAYVQIGDRYAKYFEVKLMRASGSGQSDNATLFWTVVGKVLSV